MANFNILNLIDMGCLNLLETEDKNIDVLALLFKEETQSVVCYLNKTETTLYCDSALSNPTIDLITAISKTLSSVIPEGCPTYRVRTNIPPTITEVTVTKPILSKADIEVLNRVLVANNVSSMLVKTEGATLKAPKERVYTLSTPREIELYGYTSARSVSLDNYATDVALHTNLTSIFKKFKFCKGNTVMFCGPAGTGKSTAALSIANAMGAPALVLTINSDTKPSTLLGSLTVNPNKVSDSDPEFIFLMGPLLEAYTLGYHLVLDEINYASPEVSAVYHQFLDGDAYYKLPDTGELYKRHPNFCLYFTLNQEYEGTQQLNEAFKSRTEIVQFFKLSEKDFTDRLLRYAKKNSYPTSEKFCTLLYKYIEMMSDIAKKFPERVAFCIRQAFLFMDSVFIERENFDYFSESLFRSSLYFLSVDNDNTSAIIAEKTSQLQKGSLTNKLFDEYETLFVGELKADPSQLPDLNSLVSAEIEDDFSSTLTSISSDMDDVTKTLDSLFN